MLAAVGDLLEDIVVTTATPINPAADTDARIARRRGGSAANVVATAAALGRPTRFLGQVGEDRAGTALVAELRDLGVDVTHVRRGGSTGTIVVLVDDRGERTMLTDRRACIALDRPDPLWLDRVSVLHAPLYSLEEPPLATTTLTLLDRCREVGIDTSVDLSSTTTIDALGPDQVRAMLAQLRPTVVFANADEASLLGIDRPLAGAITVVKHGDAPAEVFHAGGRVAVPAPPVEHVTDTTGAGDAFAAGFLTSDFRDDPERACRAGHRAAAELLGSRAATPDL